MNVGRLTLLQFPRCYFLFYYRILISFMFLFFKEATYPTVWGGSASTRQTPSRFSLATSPKMGAGPARRRHTPCRESESERGVERGRCRDCNCNCAVPWAIKSIFNWDRPALWRPLTPPTPLPSSFKPTLPLSALPTPSSLC